MNSARALIATLLILTWAGCRSGTPRTDEGQRTPDAAQTPNDSRRSWSEKMQDLSAAVRTIFPLTLNRADFSKPENAEKIESSLTRLQTLAHSVNSGGKPNKDPLLEDVSLLLTEDLGRALRGFRSGQREYARAIVRDSLAHCIHCHTQIKGGPEYPKLDLGFNAQSFPPLVRADFYSATRQFDEALKEYKLIIKDAKTAQEDLFTWEQAGRAALGIAVRLRQDPVLARTIVVDMNQNKGITDSTRRLTKAWLESIDEWSKERKPALLSPRERLNLAGKLIDRARAKQAYPADHSQDVVYLRASGILHEWLGVRRTNDEMAAEALLKAGLSAEALREQNVWTLHERYYERCIRTFPKSATAKTCYTHLEESIQLGYTGSAGVNLPAEEVKRLGELRRLAHGE